MTRRLLIPMLLAAASVAHAQPVGAPAGWTEDRTHGAVIQRDVLATLPADARPEIVVWSFRAPTGGGGQVIVWELKVAAATPGEFVRTRVDDLRGAPALMAAGGGKTRTINWQERTVEDGTVIEANLEWAQDDVGLVSVNRSLWTLPEGGSAIVERRVECVLASDARELREACDRTIAALAPPAGARGKLEVPAAIADAEPDTMREAPPTTGPVIVKPPKPRSEGTDLRPFYVIGFILVVIAILWWNKKKRQEALKEEPAAESKEDKPSE